MVSFGFTPPRRWLCLALLVASIFPASLCWAVQLPPEQAEQLQQAQKAQRAGDHARAVELLEALRQKHPEEPDLPRLLAQSYAELDQPRKARQAAIEAIGLGRLTRDLLIRLVRIDRQRGDRLALLNELRLLTVIDADNPTWRIAYGDALLELDRHQEALAVYDKAISAQPGRAELWLRLGNARIRADQPARAATALETAWRLGRQERSMALTLAGLHEQQGDPLSAVSWLERALAAESTPELRLRRARLLLKIGQRREVREAAEALITEQTPSDVSAQAHLLLGRLALQDQDAATAIEHLEAAERQGDRSRTLLRSLAYLRFNRGEHAQAAEWLVRYLADQPNDREAHRLLVRCLLLSNQAGRARQRLVEHLEWFGVDEATDALIQSLADRL